MKDDISRFRHMEGLTEKLFHSLKNKTFNSEEELRKYLNGMIGKDIDDIESTSKSALDMAQDLIYDAWEEENRRKRIQLAKEALSICRDCADAYVLLAEEVDTLEEAKKLYEKAVMAGERALGKDVFKEDKGHFWGILKTRPYMRARAGLAQCLWERGEWEEAIRHYKQMLELNPNDNQGIRYILAACLAELGRYEELERFLNESEYKDDGGTDWLYIRMLSKFVRYGDSSQADTALKIALKSNPYVPEYLTGKKIIPDILPDMAVVGSEDEAMCCASNLYPAWKKAPGAINWLIRKTAPTTSKIGRNQPCPCGSGKKYKKCCGR